MATAKDNDRIRHPFLPGVTGKSPNSPCPDFVLSPQIAPWPVKFHHISGVKDGGVKDFYARGCFNHRLEDPIKDPIEAYREQLRRQVTVLREYAKWCLLRGYVFPPSRESHRRDLMREFFQAGAQVQLTERDMVLLLFRGLLCHRS
jgi:hypothetical protein